MSLATATKGEIVVLLGFTGIRLADMKIKVATKTELHIEKKDGSLLIFDRKTGIQKNVAEGKEKYANKIVDPEDAPAPKKKAELPTGKQNVKKAAKKPAPVEVDEDDEDEDEEEVPAPKAKAKKKAAPAPVVDEDEDDEDEEEEVPAPKKKKAAAPAPKAKKKPVVEDDEDDYEEM